jgi:hypothetical protein
MLFHDPRGARALRSAALRSSLSGPPDQRGRPAAALPRPKCANHGLRRGCEPARRGPSAAAGPTLHGSRPRKGRARPAHRAIGDEAQGAYPACTPSRPGSVRAARGSERRVRRERQCAPVPQACGGGKWARAVSRRTRAGLTDASRPVARTCNEEAQPVRGFIAPAGRGSTSSLAMTPLRGMVRGRRWTGLASPQPRRCASAAFFRVRIQSVSAWRLR